MSAKNVDKSKTKRAENNGELFQEFHFMSSSQKVFTFLKNTSGRLLLEFLWWTASGKMVKWQKSNGEHFQMFQKQSPSSVLLKRCLSFLKNTSGGMLLEFLKNRYLVSRILLFLLSSQKK